MTHSARRGAASLAGLALVVSAWWWLGARAGTEETQAGEPTSAQWSVVFVIDGDTFDAERNGETERVRIIGIDTPERDQCGYAEATTALRDAIGGRTVTLVAGAPTDRDAYGRLLRYVEVDGADAGLGLVRRGLAVARYDSRSGQPHDREIEYWEADDASAPLCP